MNANTMRSAERIFRVIFIFVFVMGTVCVPGKSAEAQKPESDKTLNGKPSDFYLPELTDELGIITTIPVESMPTGVGVNPNTNRIYVSNHGSDSVSVIDGATNSLIATVLIGDGPHGLSVNPDTNRIYVANHGSGPWGTTVSVIDGDTNTVIATVPVGVRPVGVAVNPNTNRIYVANFESNTISVIDGITNTVSATVSVGSGPHGIAVNPVTNRIYVGIYWGSSVDVIDGDTNTVVASVPVGSPVAGIAVNPVTNRIYATNHHSTTVAVVDDTTNTMIDWVEVGSQPHGIAVNPNTNRIYVANYASSDVAVIDGTTGAVTDTIPVGGLAVGAGINPNTDRIYITVHSQNMVSVITGTASHNQPPVADAGGPYTGFVGEAITFDASASSDPDGDPLTYEWDLDNDGAYDDATGMTVTHTFDQAGEYPIGLRVTDALGLIVADATTVTISQRAPNPLFFVEPNEDNVYTWNWTAGTLLTITIDDLDTTQNPDYSGTIYASALDDWDHGLALSGIFDIKPGHVVTVSGEGITKQHIVSHLTVTNIDIDADTVSGTGTPGSWIHVGTECDENGCANRNVIVAPTGIWMVDFSTPVTDPWDGMGTLDLRPGSDSHAYENDEDNDSTKVRWYVYNPTIVVRPWEDFVHGWGWPDGAWVTMTLDYPDTPQSPDYTETNQASYSAPWSPQNTLVAFVNGALDIKAGDIVTMTDGNITKTHITTSLTVDEFDVNADTISGTAEPGTEVSNVNVCDDTGCSQRTVTADSSGHWTTDFSVPGDADHPEIIDIRPNTEGVAIQHDDDGDDTHIGWRVPDPTFFVVDSRESNCCAYNVVGGKEWEPGKTISLYIDDPSNGVGWDYQDSLIASDGQNGWANYQWTFYIDPREFPIEPGDLVRVTDGTTVKEHVVKDLVITKIDLDADTIEGRSNSNEQLYVPVMKNDRYVERYVSPEINGHWSADFSQPGQQGNEQALFDITPGTLVIPEQADEDGDSTKFWMNVTEPRIFALLGEQRVHAWGWLAGTPLTLTIDNPATPQSPDYTGTQTATAYEDWDYGFDWGITLDVQPGYQIRVSGGGITKELVVAHLSVTSVDMEADTVSGTGDPGYEIHVGLLCDDNSCTRRNVYVDSNGNWLADFSVPGMDDDETVFDIRPGSGTGVYQIDEDNDATNVGWNLPYPPAFQVRANWDIVEGSGWTLGDTVTIEVNDPLTSDDIDYSGAATVGVADWDPNQTWFSIATENYDLKAGDTVTVKDETITKQLLIPDFRITNVDLDTDRVYGKAKPGQYVNIWTCWHDNPCVNRDETADANGDWFTDFSVPGEKDWEQETADLQAESWIDSSVIDDDGDQIMSGWYVEIPDNEPPVANAGPDWIVYAGEIITLDASTSSDPEAGMLTYQWDLDNDGQYDDASGATVTTSFYMPGNHVFTLQVTDDGGLTDTDTVTIVVLAWTIKGFYQPVDMNGVYNTVKGGSTVPLKFEILAGPTELTDITNVKSLTYAETTCDASVVTDEIELVATGGTSLRYDAASGQFIYNWKTPKAAGKCYRVTLTLMDGSSLVAYFKLK